MQLPSVESNHMLTLVDIKKKDASHCIVTLDRDGKEMIYEFHLHLPDADHPDRIPSIGPPVEIDYDLIDYELTSPPGTPHGAICIPFMGRLCTLVSRVNRGIPVDLPVVLDER